MAGTGYQYADTDFLAYSAKLYAQFAHALRAGRAGTPIAVGTALVSAKQQYLFGLSTVTGVDQKTVLEAALYGLPALLSACARPTSTSQRRRARTPGRS